MKPAFLDHYLQPAPLTAPPAHERAAARDLYFELYNNPDQAQAAAQAFLAHQIGAVQAIPSDLPASLDALHAWMLERTEAVGAAYRDYLAARKTGAARRYFSNRAHALYFIKAVAPTKLVDGSWLFGLLRHWDNPDFHPLIKTYLEELGDGAPDKNHVTIFRKLIATHGCDGWQQLDDSHFVQGAIQLALAHNAEDYLAEVIGFNLGYEQLPLHLLITSYELNELGIDPYYFTLHVTVDNAANGHAAKAVDALKNLMPRVGDSADFYRRVIDGYRLNELGASTNSTIASFDLDAELIGIMAAKSVTGKNMHSDYCRVAGKSINDWLASPDNVPAFMLALETAGWITRGADPEQSRFWSLIQGDKAEMFGVFSPYEQQVLRDWIASPRAAVEDAANDRSGAAVEEQQPIVLSHRARQRMLANVGQLSRDGEHPLRGLIRRRPDQMGSGVSELHLLEEQIAALPGKQQAMALLASLMGPASHHSAVGLMATRMYSQLLDH
ncbi:iron-containing redox enzyme family protein [Massilia sp. S19_KUP03_FR1]|uniref:iron-containing redox enzyme family protein n=1 Tax=Massilia sp. S19_KUP03_FR1 TaxID=3025503 RepID=UPI002FCDAC21